MDKKEALSAVLNDWKDSSGRTLHFISERTGIGYSTVRKISQQDTDTSDSIVLRLLAFMYPTNPVFIHDFAVKYCPSLVPITQLMVDLKASTVELPALNSSALLALLKISCSQSGMPQKEVELIIGANAESTIQKLLELELINRKNDNLIASSDMMYIVRQSSLREIAGIALNSVDPTAPANLMHIGFEGLNRDTVEEIRVKLEETNDYIVRKFQDAKNRGEYKIITSLIMTTI